MYITQINSTFLIWIIPPLLLINITQPQIFISPTQPHTDIHRRDCILTWSVILSVHGADPIAEVKLLISPFLRWSLIMKSIIEFLNNSNIHAIVSTSLIINLHWLKKIYFAVLEDIYNNVFPLWSVVFISRNHYITRLIS
jgi:hypothetical protein